MMEEPLNNCSSICSAEGSPGMLGYRYGALIFLVALAAPPVIGGAVSSHGIKNSSHLIHLFWCR